MAIREFLSAWSGLINPVVSVVISALVARHTAGLVATKNAKKQAFTEILERLDELDAAARCLFLVPGNDPTAQSLFSSVRSADNKLGMRLRELFNAHPISRPVTHADPVPSRIAQARIELRQLAVADDLLVPGRAAYAAIDPIFDELEEAIRKLRSAIRSAASDMDAGDLCA